MGGIHRGTAAKTDYWYKFQSNDGKSREFASFRGAKKWIRLRGESGRVLEFQIVGAGSNVATKNVWYFRAGDLTS